MVVVLVMMAVLVVAVTEARPMLDNRSTRRS
jgi:hypothetical protein